MSKDALAALAVAGTVAAGKRMYSVAEFRAAYGIGHTMAHQLIASGEVPSVKIGRRRLIPVDEAEKWEQSLLAENRGATR